MRVASSSVLSILVFLLAACAQPVLPPASVPSVESADPGLLLTGRVVTMNEAGEVLDGGRVWIRNGRIAAVFAAGAALPAAAETARRVETGGAIYPGLIDLHNQIGRAHV